MAKDAFSLRCPGCGAPADPDAGRCAFCQRRLATVSCPVCFALIFDGAAHCPACGAARRRSDAEDIGVPCPECRGSLQRLAVGVTMLLECSTCDGVWLDAPVFEQLCADREAQAAVLHQFPARPGGGADRVRYRPCARCGKMMNRVNFGRLSGTIVDVCRGHGTFLDPGELHRIVEFILGGGLDRARARQIEELRDQERRVRDAEGRLARERGKTNVQPGLGGLSRWTFMIGD